MGVLPGEMDWTQKSWCKQNPCKCAAGGKWSDVYAAVPDSNFCNTESPAIPKLPVVIPKPPTSTKPPAEKSSGINFGLIALLAAVLL